MTTRMERIGIIGAMEEEVMALRQALTELQEHGTPFSDLPIFTGKLNGEAVVIAINSGVAGGLSPEVKIGQIVIGHSAMQHDFDVNNFGYPQGTIPRLETSIFKGDSRLVNLATTAAQSQVGPSNVHQGLVVSGDQFVSSLDQKQRILESFPAATCVEMEGAAIAHVAWLNQVPHVIVRAISDQADNTAPDDFDAYLLEIIPTLNGVISKLVSLLKD